MTMTENDRLLLNAYIDGELDPAHALEFERRLADNGELAAIYKKWNIWTDAQKSIGVEEK